jgi:hypothetical protein
MRPNLGHALHPQSLVKSGRCLDIGAGQKDVVQVENFHERKFTMDASPTARLKRARSSLEGLTVGDAFGQGFFMSFERAARLMASEEFAKPLYDFPARELPPTRPDVLQETGARRAFCRL